MKKTCPPESWEQKQLFTWIRANQARYPKLQMAYSTLNGVRLSPKLRAEMTAQGNRKGVPDIVIPCRSADNKYCGLYLELKRTKGGVTSKEQREYIAMLQKEGYLALVVNGWERAQQVILGYFREKGR